MIPFQDFKCPDCGRPVGAEATELDDHGNWISWALQPCIACEHAKNQKAADQRRREFPRALAGVDVDAAIADLCIIPVLAELVGKRAIQVSVGHRAYGTCGGRAWVRRRKIRIYGGSSATPERVLEVIIHELCHIATPNCSHNERFRRVFARAVREAWGIVVPIDPERCELKNRSYAQGEIVVEELGDLIKTGWIKTYPAKPKEPKPRETVIAEVVERRAIHALKMLKQAERRLQIAKTVHQRWAKKVRYYEKEAARRGK